MNLLKSLKNAIDIVNEKKFQVNFYDVNEQFIEKKEMTIPEINLFLMGHNYNSIILNIQEKE